MIIYTVITNNYDVLKKVTPTEDVKYICFTDDLSINPNGWELREATNHNRWYKFHSHLLFPDEEFTIYIDGHGELVSNPEEIIKELGEFNIGQQKHPVRECLYEEAYVVCKMGLDNQDNVDEVIDYYSRAGFPEEFGLYANGCIVRRNCEEVNTWNNRSWHILTSTGLRRDQLVTQFVTWSTGTKIKAMKLFKWGKHNV